MTLAFPDTTPPDLFGTALTLLTAGAEATGAAYGTKAGSKKKRRG